MTSWHALFSGEVQGVGFRYTAGHLANLFGVTGWVRNLDNGTVELTTSGPQSKLLIDTLQEKFNCQVTLEKSPRKILKTLRLFKTAAKSENWSREQELNLRPAHYECAALPTELSRQNKLSKTN